MIPRLDKWSWIWMLTFSKKLIYAGLDRIWKLVSWLTIKTGSSLFLSQSIVVCIFVTPWTLKNQASTGLSIIDVAFHEYLRRMCKKQNATHFQHYLRNSKWCNSSQNKNTNYESRGYVRMLCTDEMRMISLLIEVVSTPCTSTSKELFLATQQMWHNSRFASQLIWHRKMLFEHYDLYSYYLMILIT